MTNLNQGHARLTWWLLLESARRAAKGEIPEEDRIIELYSPWMRDVPIDASMWSQESLAVALKCTPNEVESLSDVLKLMRKNLKFRINVCIRDSPRRSIPQANDRRNLQEARMMNRLKLADINTLKANRDHSKMLATPIGALTGSMNFTYAGMRINRENTHIYFRSQDPQGYQIVSDNVHRNILGAIPFFEDQILDLEETQRRFPVIEQVLGEQTDEPPTNEDELPEATEPDDELGTSDYEPMESVTIDNTTTPTVIPTLGNLPTDDLASIETRAKVFASTTQWEEKLREVALHVYANYSDKISDWRAWAESKNEHPKIGKEWPNYICVKLIKTEKELSDFEMHDGLRKKSLFSHARKRVIEKIRTQFSQKITKGELEPGHLVHYGTDLAVLRTLCGLNRTALGKDASGSNLMPAWKGFFKEMLLSKPTEVEHLFTQFAFHFNRIYDLRNDNSHTLMTERKIRGVDMAMQFFHEELFEPFDKIIQV